MKLPRAVYATWLSFDKEKWTLIGKDTDNVSLELNPEVETKQNVLGETIVDHSGFKPELALDNYFARTEDAIYEHIKDLAMNRKSDEESTGAYLLEAILTDEVKKSDTVTLTGQAWMENVVVVPQSYGGDTTGFAIPFNISMNGGRTEGSVSVTKRVPTFTEGAAVETQTINQTAGTANSTAKKAES
ncbi:MAG: hypothetical protein HDR06_12170 [Lachnospiraceae bacterium]|nr:hypothetical protein [Lachnospiraceae bacterium]